MKYLIVGNGPAGITAAQTIRKNDSRGKITVITNDKYPFYYKPKLPAMLAKEVSLDTITLKKPEWYDTQKISVDYDTVVGGIDPANHTISLLNGDTLDYNRLLLATGASPFAPPIDGISGISGIYTFRNAEDVFSLDKIIDKSEHVTMIGGGLLALENGRSLVRRGKNVRVIEIMPRLLPRQLDKEGALVLQNKLENMGFTFFLKKQAVKIEQREGRINCVVMDNGDKFETDLLLMCAGVRPNTGLAGSSGIKTDRGIIVDNYMRTSQEDIWAAGDCASFNGKSWGLWTVAMRQGTAAGNSISGGNGLYEEEVNTTKLKITGIDLISAGRIDEDGRETLVYRSEGVYRKLFLENGRASGCILLGNISNEKNIIKCLNKNINIEKFKDNILNPDFNEWNFI